MTRLESNIGIQMLNLYSCAQYFDPTRHRAAVMKKFQTFTEWTTCFANEGCFDHLNQLVAFDEWPKWPSCEVLESLFPYEIKNRNNKSIRFVSQSPKENFSAVAYEEVIYTTGKVPTRKESWHDVFGALTWSLFPKTKATINKLHHDDIQKNGKEVRSTLRNALTLFDECGVILVSKNTELLNDLKNHNWSSAFIDNRDKWGEKSEQGVLAFQFGHANYEMLTKPYEGLTGKWLHLDISAELASLPLNVQYRMVDEKFAEIIEQGALNDNSNLSPLPLLGIPDWYSKNEDVSFYDNTDYFRSKR